MCAGLPFTYIPQTTGRAFIYGMPDMPGMPAKAARVALVTGASKGLGAEVALALGHAGYRVIACYHRDRDGAEAVASSIGDGASAAGVDVSDMSRVEALIEHIKANEGRLDLLINNAGITADSLVARASISDWERVLAVNLDGSHNMTRASAPLIASSGGGHIVNVSSRSGLLGNAGQAAYSASKAALLGLTTAKARELAGVNIRVNAIVPGYMPTDMGRDAVGAMERAKTDSLLDTLADPKEAASFIVWLASTGRITGQVFSLDSRLDSRVQGVYGW